MAQKYPYDGYTKVALVTSITNISAPTVAELNAGTDISCFLPKDGVNLTPTTQGVDTGSLCTQFDSQIAGSNSINGSLKGFRFNDGDTFWDLANLGDITHVVIREGTAVDTAWAANDDVRVYKVQMGEPAPTPTAANAPASFELPLFVAAYDQKAVVAA